MITIFANGSMRGKPKTGWRNADRRYVAAIEILDRHFPEWFNHCTLRDIQLANGGAEIRDAVSVGCAPARKALYREFAGNYTTTPFPSGMHEGFERSRDTWLKIIRELRREHRVRSPMRKRRVATRGK